MTTYVNFTQPPDAAFQFTATLDGNPYTVTVTWNLFGQRYYVNIYSADGVLIVCLPRIASPPISGALSSGRDISLTAGYFTSTMIWRDESQWFEISP
jgi:hypothetical protein